MKRLRAFRLLWEVLPCLDIVDEVQSSVRVVQAAGVDRERGLSLDFTADFNCQVDNLPVISLARIHLVVVFSSISVERRTVGTEKGWRCAADVGANDGNIEAFIQRIVQNDKVAIKRDVDIANVASKRKVIVLRAGVKWCANTALHLSNRQSEVPSPTSGYGVVKRVQAGRVIVEKRKGSAYFADFQTGYPYSECRRGKKRTCKRGDSCKTDHGEIVMLRGRMEATERRDLPELNGERDQRAMGKDLRGGMGILQPGGNHGV